MGYPAKLSRFFAAFLAFVLFANCAFAYKAETPSGKTVIHIQDIHGNLEAQKNIGAEVGELIEKKQVGLVALEGAFGTIDLAPFHAFPHQDTIGQVADYLLRENKISGPIHALLRLRSGQVLPMIRGIDDRKHYTANVEAARESMLKAASLRKVLAVERRRLAERKEKVFNAELLAFDRKIQAYRSGRLTIENYIALLLRHARPPRTSKKIDADALSGELEKMESRALSALAETPREKRLVDESRRLYLVGKLLDLSLTQREWDRYKSLGIRVPGLELAAFEAFYREAEARDRAMADNLIKAMEHSSTAVLVTGGFHSAGIDKRLHEAGIATIRFAPKISRVDSGQYLSAFSQEKTPLEKLFAGENLFLAGPPCSAAAQADGALRTFFIEMRRGILSPEFLRTWLCGVFRWTGARVMGTAAATLKILPSGKNFGLTTRSRGGASPENLEISLIDAGGGIEIDAESRPYADLILTHLASKIAALGVKSFPENLHLTWLHSAFDITSDTRDTGAFRREQRGVYQAAANVPTSHGAGAMAFYISIIDAEAVHVAQTLLKEEAGLSQPDQLLAPDAQIAFMEAGEHLDHRLTLWITKQIPTFDAPLDIESKVAAVSGAHALGLNYSQQVATTIAHWLYIGRIRRADVPAYVHAYMRLFTLLDFRPYAVEQAKVIRSAVRFFEWMLEDENPAMPEVHLYSLITQQINGSHANLEQLLSNNRDAFRRQNIDFDDLLTIVRNAAQTDWLHSHDHDKARRIWSRIWAAWHVQKATIDVLRQQTFHFGAEQANRLLAIDTPEDVYRLAYDVAPASKRWFPRDWFPLSLFGVFLMASASDSSKDETRRMVYDFLLQFSPVAYWKFLQRHEPQRLEAMEPNTRQTLENVVAFLEKKALPLPISMATYERLQMEIGGPREAAALLWPTLSDSFKKEWALLHGKMEPGVVYFRSQMRGRADTELQDSFADKLALYQTPGSILFQYGEPPVSDAERSFFERATSQQNFFDDQWTGKQIVEELSSRSDHSEITLKFEPDLPSNDFNELVRFSKTVRAKGLRFEVDVKQRSYSIFAPSEEPELLAALFDYFLEKAHRKRVIEFEFTESGATVSINEPSHAQRPSSNLEGTAQEDQLMRLNKTQIAVTKLRNLALDYRNFRSFVMGALGEMRGKKVQDPYFLSRRIQALLDSADELGRHALFVVEKGEKIKIQQGLADIKPKVMPVIDKLFSEAAAKGANKLPPAFEECLVKIESAGAIVFQVAQSIGAAIEREEGAIKKQRAGEAGSGPGATIATILFFLSMLDPVIGTTGDIGMRASMDLFWFFVLAVVFYAIELPPTGPQILEPGHPAFDGLFPNHLRGDDAVLNAAESMTRFTEGLGASSRMLLRVYVHPHEQPAWKAAGFEPVSCAAELQGFLRTNPPTFDRIEIRGNQLIIPLKIPFKTRTALTFDLPEQINVARAVEKAKKRDTTGSKQELVALAVSLFAEGAATEEFFSNLLGLPTDAGKDLFVEFSGSQKLGKILMSEEGWGKAIEKDKKIEADKRAQEKTLERENQRAPLRAEQQKNASLLSDTLLRFLEERAASPESALQPGEKEELTNAINAAGQEAVLAAERIIRDAAPADSIEKIRKTIQEALDTEENRLRKRIVKATEPPVRQMIIERPQFRYEPLNRQLGEAWLMKVARAISGRDISDIEQALMVFSFYPDTLHQMNLRIVRLHKLIELNAPNVLISNDIELIQNAGQFFPTVRPTKKKRKYARELMTIVLESLDVLSTRFAPEAPVRSYNGGPDFDLSVKNRRENAEQFVGQLSNPDNPYLRKTSLLHELARELFNTDAGPEELAEIAENAAATDPDMVARVFIMLRQSIPHMNRYFQWWWGIVSNKKDIDRKLIDAISLLPEAIRKKIDETFEKIDLLEAEARLPEKITELEKLVKAPSLDGAFDEALKLHMVLMRVEKMTDHQRARIEKAMKTLEDRVNSIQPTPETAIEQFSPQESETLLRDYETLYEEAHRKQFEVDDTDPKSIQEVIDRYESVYAFLNRQDLADPNLMMRVLSLLGIIRSNIEELSLQLEEKSLEEILTPTNGNAFKLEETPYQIRFMPKACRQIRVRWKKDENFRRKFSSLVEELSAKGTKGDAKHSTWSGIWSDRFDRDSYRIYWVKNGNQIIFAGLFHKDDTEKKGGAADRYLTEVSLAKPGQLTLVPQKKTNRLILFFLNKAPGNTLRAPLAAGRSA